VFWLLAGAKEKERESARDDDEEGVVERSIGKSNAGG